MSTFKTITEASSDSTAEGGDTWAINTPTNADDDVMIAAFAQGVGGRYVLTSSLAGSVWTEIANFQMGGSFNFYLQVFVKKASSEPASYSWKMNSPSWVAKAAMFSISGLEDPGTVAPVVATQANAASGGLLTVPSVTPTQQSALVCFAVDERGASTMSVNASYSSWTQHSSSPLIGAAYKDDQPASASGTMQWDYTPTWHAGGAVNVALAILSSGGPAPHHIRRSNSMTGGMLGMGM